MKVFPLRYPGQWPANMEGEQSARVKAGFVDLEFQLASAAVGLELFKLAVTSNLDRIQDRQGETRWINRRRELEEALRLSDHQDRPCPLSNREDELRAVASIRVLEERAASGDWPLSYESQLPIIHAHTVLFALDGVRRMLSIMADQGVSPGIGTALKDFDARLPQLTQVRDSAHHREDRSRGMKKGNKPLNLKPVVTGGIHAPHGGALVIAGLANESLQYTGADGETYLLPITDQTVKDAADAIQAAINSLPWSGHPYVVPW